MDTARLGPRWRISSSKPKILPLASLGVVWAPGRPRGFIPDPHFLSSEAMPLSEPVLKMLSHHDGSFRLIDVNPFFNDRTSEILLVVTLENFDFRVLSRIPEGAKCAGGNRLS